MSPVTRDEEFERRFAKIEKVRAEGGNPYPVRFDRDRTIGELRAEFGALEPGEETDVSVKVAGRLLLIRRQGKLSFGSLRDGTGEVQLFVSQKVIGPESHAAFDDLDLGDWVGVEGTVMTTRKGELSVKVRDFALLSKALRPVPKWHGLSDVDTRYRQRYADLIVNERAREVFEIRFKALNAIREFLAARGFVEVEGPVLHEQAGGATARPFYTHHNALDLDLVLRIALELHLKRLIVGGLEQRVRDRSRVPQRRTVDPSQPRVHDARALRSLRGLHGHHGVDRGDVRARGDARRSARRSSRSRASPWTSRRRGAGRRCARRSGSTRGWTCTRRCPWPSSRRSPTGSTSPGSPVGAPGS